MAVGYEKRFPSEILRQAGAPERLDRSLLEGVSGVVMAGGASLGGGGPNGTGNEFTRQDANASGGAGAPVVPSEKCSAGVSRVAPTQNNPLAPQEPLQPVSNRKDNRDLGSSSLGFAKHFALHPGLWGISGTALACVSQNLYVGAGFFALSLYAAYNEARLASPSLGTRNQTPEGVGTEEPQGPLAKALNLAYNVSSSRGVAYTVNATYGSSVAIGCLFAGKIAAGCAFALIAAGSAAVSFNLNKRRDDNAVQPRESFEFLKSIQAAWDRLRPKVQGIMAQPSLWYCSGVGALYFERMAGVLLNGTPVAQVATVGAAGLMAYGAVGPVVDLLQGKKVADSKPLMVGGVLGFLAMGAALAPHLGIVGAGSFALWAAGNYLNARRMQALQNGTAKAAYNAETGGTT